MADFMTTGVPKPLTDDLQQGMNRVENYQTIQRGTDSRSGNIIRTDISTKRRIVIGLKTDGSPIVAISIDGIDVMDALEE